jgi:hypothetical protein
MERPDFTQILAASMGLAVAVGCFTLFINERLARGRPVEKRIQFCAVAAMTFTGVVIAFWNQVDLGATLFSASVVAAASGLVFVLAPSRLTLGSSDGERRPGGPSDE